MWTATTRAQHKREGLRFASDLTDAEWAVLAPLLPPRSPVGRPPAWPMRDPRLMKCCLSGDWRRLRLGASLVVMDLPGRGMGAAAAIRTETEGGAAAIGAFLNHFAAVLPEGVHAALRLDGAGWHAAGEIVVPANVSPVFLPPYSPKLNPAGRLWLSLRERFLSLRLFRGLDDIIDGCCNARNRMLAEPGRVASLTNFPYRRSVRTSWGGYQAVH